MIDGANPWQKFWKLTFPMLLPFVSINLILSTKNMMMVFDPDHVFDQRWSGTEYRIHLVSDL